MILTATFSSIRPKAGEIGLGADDRKRVAVNLGSVANVGAKFSHGRGPRSKQRCTGIGGKLGERKMPRWADPGRFRCERSRNDPRNRPARDRPPGFRAALGATGDVNRPVEAEPRQQSRKPASIATGVERGRRTSRARPDRLRSEATDRRDQRSNRSRAAASRMRFLPMHGWAPRHRARARATA